MTTQTQEKATQIIIPENKSLIDRWLDIHKSWIDRNLDFDTAPRSEQLEIQSVIKRIMEATGFTWVEVCLIANSRMFGVLREVNTYLHKLCGSL